VTPKLEVQFSFFSDLRPLPDTTDHILNESGGLEEVGRQISASIERETDVTIVMQKEAAVNLIEVLHQMIAQIDKHIDEAIKAVPKDPNPVGSSEVAL
jgi:hypothetical protein